MNNIVELGKDNLNGIIKFLEEWEVETPTGFKPFKGVKRITLNKYYKFRFRHGDEIKYFKCSTKHKLLDHRGIFKKASVLKKGSKLYNNLIVLEKQLIREPVDLYDLLEVEDGNTYITEGLFVNHNCAFIDNIEETFTAAQQTLATGGQCIALSTPNGMGNWFHRMWVAAELGENTFIPVKLKWDVHPERDQTWRDKQDLDLGLRMAAQECLTGDTLVKVRNIKTGEIEDITLRNLEKRLEEDEN